MGEYYDGLLNLFQIATTNNWQDIMYANVLERCVSNFRKR